MIYSLYTLVDITETGQYRSRSDIERLQQQNFDTVIQTIGLAGNIASYKTPEIVNGDIFGNESLRCWYFEWTMEREQVFEYNGDELYRLKELFEFVTIIDKLDESVTLDKPVFVIGRNIIFDFKP
jgi:hypothetical protein